jgi:hypothetical protein
MAPPHCEHRKTVHGLVDLDFSRQNASNGSRYSSTVAFRICEECGRIELDAKSHRELCDWLKMKNAYGVEETRRSRL